MSEKTALRLYPVPGVEIPVEDVYLDLDPPPCSTRDVGLPYVAINMVSSLDGKVSVGGRANDIGGQADRKVMRNLRASFDAVLRGAGTLRAEKISAGVPDPLAELRVSRGLPEQPYEIILTKTGDVPVLTNLLNVIPDNTLVIVPEAMASGAISAGLGSHGIVVGAETRPDGNVHLPEALRLLKSRHGIGRILVEGGPTLNHALLSDNLTEGLFLTVAPKFIGGHSRETLSLMVGEVLPKDSSHPELRSVHLANGELFLYYEIQ